MAAEPQSYPPSHWLRSPQRDKVLAFYARQQRTPYSRTKNRFIRELLGDLGGKRILDFGCGAGLFTVTAAGCGAAMAVGIDAQKTALAAAHQLAAAQDVSHLTHFICSRDLSGLRRETAFDVVLLKDVIEHVPDDQHFLGDVARVTAPNGVVVICTQNAFSLNYLLEGTYHRHLLRNKSWYGWDPTHLRFYTPTGLKRSLARVGFVATAWRSLYLIPHKIAVPWRRSKQFVRVLPLSRLDRYLGRWPPANRLGWNFIVRADKRTV